jgi:hypothetical protein
MDVLKMLNKCGDYIIPGLVEQLGPAKRMAALAKGKRLSARNVRQG